MAQLCSHGAVGATFQARTPARAPCRMSMSVSLGTTKQQQVQHQCCAVNPKAAEALRSLKPTGPKVAVVDPVYNAAAEYLRSIVGITNLGEINRILDVAMNPNSLFLAQAKNANARPLDVDKDIRPVIDFMHDKQVSASDIMKIVSGHPPVLSYSTEQLEKMWEYLTSLGIADVGAVIVKRPNLLGLDVDKNLRKIVEYLQYVETPPETIVKYLTESL